MNPSDIKFEIGHVLFIDIVGYSKLLIAEQSNQMQTLREIVRGTEQFKKAEAEGKLLRLPTGDGGALVFRNSLEAPVLCALEISKALRTHPELKVRMGIHSGPVNEITDLNEQANIAGVGINLAQRIMDCGDAGHILLSKRVADDLEEYPQWRSHLSDLGECEVKHGTRVSVVNLFTDEAGNRHVPQKFQTVTPVPSSSAGASDGKRRIAAKHLITSALIVVALIVAATVGFFSRNKSGAISTPQSTQAATTLPAKSIAVLPFEYLSSDKENAYFADGIQDEILTKLASIADLKVISRTSTAKYRSKPGDLRTVSQELGASKILEGSVQRAGDKVRVNVQLIDAHTDSHMWARSYDGEASNIFSFETEVSQQVADALQAKLSPAAADAIAATPTNNSAAYDLFLRGEYDERRAEDDLDIAAFERARKWYEQAIAADPRFALAIARLVENRMQVHWFSEKLDQQQLEEVKALAERAIALAPNLAQSHIALGVCYYYGYRDYERALAAFTKAIELQPNNTGALEYLGYVHRRQGKWEQSLRELREAFERDPRNAALAGNIAGSYVSLRMWKQAEEASRVALQIDPNASDAMSAVLDRAIEKDENVKEAVNLLATFPAESRITSSSVGDYGSMIGHRAYVYVLARDFDSARKVWATVKPEEERRQTSAQIAIDYLKGDKAAARDQAQKAKPLVEQRLREVPDDLLAMVELSWVNLALGDKDGALAMARRAFAALPPERDALFGPATLNGLAQIQAQTGAAAEATATLRHLLSIPSGGTISITTLKQDPVWDPIRNDPAFQQLLTLKEHLGP